MQDTTTLNPQEDESSKTSVNTEPMAPEKTEDEKNEIEKA